MPPTAELLECAKHLARRLRETARDAASAIRWAAGRQPRSPREMELWLGWMSEPTRDRPTRRLPWGEVEYTKIGALRSQFFEIFLKRHYCCRMADKSPVIVDCGGNIGMSSIWFSQEYPNAKVTVYEPDPNLAGILQRNIDRAGCRNVVVVNAAAWTQDGDLAFDASGDDSGHVDPSGGTRVRAVDLAKSLPERVDLLKMDIEGAEFEVLQHLIRERAIEQVRNLAAEFHPTLKTMPQLAQLLTALQDAGFRISFDAMLTPWMGRECAESTFEAVGAQKVLIHLFAWRSS